MSVRDHSRLAGEVQRIRGRLSYEQLARKVGVSKPVLYKAATGRTVSASTVKAIADAFGESPDHWYEVAGYPELVRKEPAGPVPSQPSRSWQVSEAPERYDDEDATMDRLFGLWGFDPPPPGPKREELKAMVRAMLEVSNRFDA